MSRYPRPSRLLGLVIVAGLFLSGCGYHFAASGDALPQGADTIYLQVLDLKDLDHIRLLGESVLPHLA